MDELENDQLGAPAARAPKKKAKAKKAAARNKSVFSEGDDVLIARKHLHGVHAIVLKAENDAVVARVNEGQYEGFLVSFPSDDFEEATSVQLDEHPNDRLDWDRYEK